MKNAIIWSQLNCTYCQQAKRLLLSEGYTYIERIVGEGGSFTKKDLLEAVPDARTVPQIFINGKYIGGYREQEKVLRDKI